MRSLAGWLDMTDIEIDPDLDRKFPFGRPRLVTVDWRWRPGSTSKAIKLVTNDRHRTACNTLNILM